MNLLRLKYAISVENMLAVKKVLYNLQNVSEGFHYFPLFKLCGTDIVVVVCNCFA